MLAEDLAHKEEQLSVAKAKAIIADRELGHVEEERQERDKACAEHLAELQKKIAELETFEAVKAKLAVGLSHADSLGHRTAASAVWPNFQGLKTRYYSSKAKQRSKT